MEMGTKFVPYLARIQDDLMASRDTIGLGARADLRSCWEWYTDAANMVKKVPRNGSKPKQTELLNLL